MNNKVTALWIVLMFGFLLILGGCANSPQTSVPTALDSIQEKESFEFKWAKRYEDLRAEGFLYIKENPEIKGLPEKISILYNTDFNDCVPISIGLQFIAMEEVGGSFSESILAVASQSSAEFMGMFLWYQDHLECAEKFLGVMKCNPKIDEIVHKKDIVAFEAFLGKEEIQVCSAETILQLLWEAQE